MKHKKFNPPSPVEAHYVAQSGYEFRYAPEEKIPLVQVNNFPALGQLTALRFLEWVSANPEGVISLPTGKTPEFFIRWVEHLLQNWDSPKTHDLLEAVGLAGKPKPNLSGLQFVQIDEFFPISPSQHNSFFDYVSRYYIKGFGIPEDRAQLLDATAITYPHDKSYQDIFPDLKVDLSLRYRHPATRQERLQQDAIESIDEFCTRYEEKIRDKGGIGFFLGGIGPDGHIAFNVRGSDYYSTTRLTPTNFETQAAAASDLGGIEVARNRLVITIGLQTISYNPDVTCLIFAAGEAKSKIVADAVQLPAGNTRPAGILQNLKNGRFYITSGAAHHLNRRQLHDIENMEHLPEEILHREVINLALRNQHRIDQISAKEVKVDPLANAVLKKTAEPLDKVKTRVRASLVEKLQAGLDPVEDEVFFHTAPHHDDIMLGYLAHLVHLVRTPRNQHHFAYLTSGFNAVTNGFVDEQLDNVLRFMESDEFHQLGNEGYFSPSYSLGAQRDVYDYLDGVAARSRSQKNRGFARRMIRNLLSIFEYESLETLPNRIREIQQYLHNQYPGQKDLPHVQQLKGRIREWEADLVWAHYGTRTEDVHHLRLGFYKGDIFTEEPTMDRDVMPVLNHLEKIRPTVVTLALDPEASGPDTHYKVMQAVAEAMRLYKERHPDAPLRVWGYRNVWFRFHPSDANIFVPISLNSMAILRETFRHCFISQVEAPFPSYEYDGPFSGLAQQIHVEQHQQLKRALGRQFWYDHIHPRMRAAHGVLYIKEMELDEFYTRARELRKVTEEFA